MKLISETTENFSDIKICRSWAYVKNKFSATAVVFNLLFKTPSRNEEPFQGV